MLKVSRPSLLKVKYDLSIYKLYEETELLLRSPNVPSTSSGTGFTDDSESTKPVDEPVEATVLPTTQPMAEPVEATAVTIDSASSKPVAEPVEATVLPTTPPMAEPVEAIAVTIDSGSAIPVTEPVEGQNCSFLDYCNINDSLSRMPEKSYPTDLMSNPAFSIILMLCKGKFSFARSFIRLFSKVFRKVIHPA